MIFNYSLNALKTFTKYLYRRSAFSLSRATIVTINCNQRIDLIMRLKVACSRHNLKAALHSSLIKKQQEKIIQ